MDIYDLRKGRFLHSYGSNREPGQIEDFNPSIQFFLSGTFLLRGGRGITTILRSDIHEDEFRSLSYGAFLFIGPEALNTDSDVHLRKHVR